MVKALSLCGASFIANSLKHRQSTDKESAENNSLLLYVIKKLTKFLTLDDNC